VEKPLLLIEDTPSLQMVYESVLRNAGYEVQTEETAAGGLDNFLKLKPNVVLLDLLLPDRDGLELMKDCLAANPTTRFIVITANGSINRRSSRNIANGRGWQRWKRSQPFPPTGTFRSMSAFTRPTTAATAATIGTAASPMSTA